MSWQDYREIWLVDFEFYAPRGERQDPLCLVAYELKSKKTLKLWSDQFGGLPPYSVDKDSLFVAYYASAELGCHLTLNWPMPANILDLYVEFRNLTNGILPRKGASLLGALSYFNIPSIESAQKEEMRGLAMRGGAYTENEKGALLDYCETDVQALVHLFGVMGDKIDLPRALLRGRYMASSAKMEFRGVPIDLKAYRTLCGRWDSIIDGLISEIDKNYGVYDGRTFRTQKFKEYLSRNNIPWPLLESGNLDLSKEAFRDMCRSYPQLQNLHELRVNLGQLRLNDLAVGSDGRNRCLLSAYAAKTGRNSPSSTAYIFGPSTWIRSLIKPGAGRALAYVDWSQQEFGIAAALSADEKMLEAYQTGDPYLSFAKQAGAAPLNATKSSHSDVRDQFKACVLAVNYGMGAASLSERINRPLPYAKHLLSLHRKTFERFKVWNDEVLNHALLKKQLWTCLGWNLKVIGTPKWRSIVNWPVQSHGSEMLRLAINLLLEAGVEVCAPVHDAVLIEGKAEEIRERIKLTQEIMKKASGIVLNGFRLRSEVTLVPFPRRYVDRRGKAMWETVWRLLS